MRIEFHVYNSRKKELNDEDGIIDVLIDEIRKMDNINITNIVFNPGIYEVAGEDNIYSKLICNIDNLCFKVILHKLTFGNNLTMKLIIEFDNIYNFEQTYAIKIAFKKVLLDHFRGCFIGIDDYNEQKCKELYQWVYQIENRFRYIINGLLVSKVGVTWFRDCAPEDLRRKTDGFSEWYRNNYTEFKDIQSELFNLQTDDLISLIENSNQFGVSKEEYINCKKTFAWAGKKFNIAVDELAELVPFKDKYFDKHLDDEFYDLWSRFKNVRNMVAHNKPLCVDFINDANQLFNQLKEKLDKIEVSIELVTTSEEQRAINKYFREYEEELYMEEAGLNSTPEYNDVVDMINDEDDVIYLIGILSDDLASLNNKSMELCEIIKDMLMGINENTKIKQLRTACIVQAMLIDCSKNLNLISLVESIPKSRKALLSFHNSFKNDSFELIDKFINREIFQLTEVSEKFSFSYVDLFNTSYIIQMLGAISPSRGWKDDLSMILKINKFARQIQEEGTIEIGYGDYELHEDGYSLPLYGDELNVDIEHISNVLSSHFDEAIEKCEEILSIIEESFA